MLKRFALNVTRAKEKKIFCLSRKFFGKSVFDAASSPGKTNFILCLLLIYFALIIKQI